LIWSVFRSPRRLIDPDQRTSEDLSAVCFFNNGSEIRLGAVDNGAALESVIAEIKENFHANVSVYLISQHSFDRAVKLYDTLPKITHLVGGVEIKEEEIKNSRRKSRLLRI